MAAITVTENLIANLNKFSKERDSKYLDSAVKSSIDLFAKQVSKQSSNNAINEESIHDFGELITMYKYTNTPQISRSVTEYYDNTIKNSLNMQDINTNEVARRIA